jgi:hypothetical protein
MRFRTVLLIRGPGRFELAAEELTHAEQTKGHVVLTQGMNILRRE